MNSHITQPKRKVVTLCGSTRFKKEYEELNESLTASGYVVISVGIFGHHLSDEKKNLFTDELKEDLDQIHKQKIDMADIVLIINKNGYIGNSTKNEIEYAKNKNKRIWYYTEILDDIIPCYFCGMNWCLCRFKEDRGF